MVAKRRVPPNSPLPPPKKSKNAASPKDTVRTKTPSKKASKKKAPTPVQNGPAHNTSIGAQSRRADSSHKFDDEAAHRESLHKDYKKFVCDTIGMSKTSLNGLVATIRRDTRVQKALKVMVNLKGTKKLKYDPTSRLLQVISLIVAPKTNCRALGADITKAIFFTSTADTCMPGAYLGDEIRPDYSSWAVTITLLASLIAGDSYVEEPLISCRISAGEDEASKRDVGGMPQIKTYTDQLLRYRPDITVAHGFSILHDNITLTSSSACGMWTSEQKSCDELLPWVMHVLLVYHTHDTSDPKIQYRPSQHEFPRWDFTLKGKTYVCVPFDSSPGPGRMTFATIVLAVLNAGETISEMELAKRFDSGEPEGFLKISSQNIAASYRESDILDKLCTGKHIPGLVRFRDSCLGKDEIVAPNEAVKRIREIMVLDSIGEPLSEAITPRQIIYAMFDLCRTLQRLYWEGVLHRDISWSNVLVNPKHRRKSNDVAGDEHCEKYDNVAGGERCSTSENVDDDKRSRVLKDISEIMNKSGLDVKSGFGVDATGRFEPCVLLTDFDHAVETNRDGNVPRRHRTGTPMFISIARGDSIPAYNSFVNIDTIYDEFASMPDSEAPAENTPDAMDTDGVKAKFEKAKEAFKLAFPDGAEEFSRILYRTLENEKKRCRAREPYDIAPDHQAYHDLESLFWVMIWAFTRASVLNDEYEHKEFETFCSDMLQHRITGSVTMDRRCIYIFNSEFLNNILHPSLQPFLPTLKTLATYFAIPWHMHPEFNAEYHFTAISRVLLSCITRLDDADLDIKLDTRNPRVVTCLNTDLRERLVSLKTRSTTSNEKVTDPPNLVSLLPPKASKDQQERSVKAFRLKVWKDILWFSRGEWMKK